MECRSKQVSYGEGRGELGGGLKMGGIARKLEGCEKWGWKCQGLEYQKDCGPGG